jgi:hypothetical protein
MRAHRSAKMQRLIPCGIQLIAFCRSLASRSLANPPDNGGCRLNEAIARVPTRLDLLRRQMRVLWIPLQGVLVLGALAASPPARADVLEIGHDGAARWISGPRALVLAAGVVSDPAVGSLVDVSAAV